MARVQVVSDLHFEFHADGGRAVADELESDADVLVVAGDLSPCAGLAAALGLLCDRYPRVVFVAGNHEYYHSSPREVAQLRLQLEAQRPGLYWLEDEVVELCGARFVGCTLWFRQTGQAVQYRRLMRDFRLIADLEPWVYEKSEASLEFLSREVRRGDVVVTHHLPSWKSVGPRFAGAPLNAFFVHDAESLIAAAQPLLWYHGHTHDSFDYRIGEARVLCNPLGYPHELNRNFNPNLIVEVGGRH